MKREKQNENQRAN